MVYQNAAATIHAQTDNSICIFWPRGLHNRRVPDSDQRSFFRYLPVSPSAQAWGAYVVNAGCAMVPAGSPYPPCQHPVDHHFTWERGRILPTYHFLYLTRGEGLFECRATGLRRIGAGDLVILYPRMWHRYRPVTEVGWDEYWLEFDGDYARRLMDRKEFPETDPVLHIGHSEPFLEVFMEVFNLLRHEPPEYDLLLGSLAVQAIAQTLSALKKRSHENRPIAEVIREAKHWLAHQPSRHERLDQFAGRLNMSYSSFRRLFKAETGYSPRQFALEVQLRRASDLLSLTEMSVSEVAESLGFESIYYFSRLFKKKTGRSPTDFRETARQTAQAESVPGDEVVS